ncbi:primase-helicase zinc-binding domain-containing protein [Escherichia coli]
MRNIDLIRQVISVSENNWPHVLGCLNINVPDSPRRHAPCPACGGKDRFRFDDNGRGSFICNQCGAGDGLDLIKRVNNCDTTEAALLAADVLGIDYRTTETPEATSQKREQLETERQRREQERLKRAEKDEQQRRDTFSRQFDDMRIMAEKGNFLTEWQKANDLSKSYIIAKQNAESVFGRDLASDAMVRKGADTLKASANTGTGAFHRLISALPEAERQPAIASILQHAVAQGEKGGIGEESGIQYFAKLMTQQNVNAISRHAPDLGRMMKEFGVLAKASTRPQRYVERTGRTTEALKTLDSGLPKIVGVIMNGVQQSGAIAGGFGGGVIGSISGLVAGGALRNTVAKIGATRSGRYAIEKAVQEATKAVRAGASPAAIAAAEKRFSANKIAMKAIRDAVGAEEFVKLTRAGIVATLSGMKDVSEWE